MSDFNRDDSYSGAEPPAQPQIDVPDLFRKAKWGLLLLALLLVLLSFGWLRSFYTDYLWFQEVGYERVLLTVVWTRAWLFALALLVVALIAIPNIYIAERLNRSLPYYRSSMPELEGLTRRLLSRAAGAAVVLGALVMALALSAEWNSILRFLHQTPFGSQEPIFNRDLSFYVFTLPVLHFARGWLMVAIVGLTILIAAFYWAMLAIRGQGFILFGPIRTHLAFLGAAVFVLIAIGHWLSRYDLLYSPHGAVYGIGYAEAHAMLPARFILTVIALISAGLMVASVFARQNRLIVWAVVLWAGMAVLAGTVFPSVVQRFQVEPNEMAREREFLTNNIRMTREAYGLDRISSSSHPARGEVDARTLSENPGTVRNVRLWDEAPLLQSYNQIQFFRLYYDFQAVTTDRYTVDGELRQVMLASRELSPEKLPPEAQRWVNRHLQFTHGYGAAMTPVTEVSPGGRPAFLLRDVPPRGQIELNRPEIYYGLKSLPFVVARSAMEEFNYPGPDGPVYTHYQGTGGVPLGSWLRRLLYSWQFRDLNLLISTEINPDSRLQYRRPVRERFSTVTPFLLADESTYLVVADGRLFWIQDAYTVTDNYPYSTPSRGRYNYIRNSVKAVIDAYNGTLNYYVADPEDPIIRTYQSIFPGLFKPLEELPEFLKPHLRYPRGLFSVQTQMLLQYHMQDPIVFYNKEDQWALPSQISFGQSEVLSSYYIVARLPGAPREEFLLLQPLTPINRHNLVAWLAARSDGENYGQLVLFRFPTGRHVDGPSQVEARIDNDAVISEQFTLWGQVGSEVSRGVLLVIPVGDSILYAEPVFLRPETLNFPELRRIILADAERVVMHPTMDAAVAALVGEVPAVAPIADTITSPARAAPPPDIARPTPPVSAEDPDMQEIRRGLREAVDRLQEVLDRLDRANP
jgi:uncharacterized protein